MQPSVVRLCARLDYLSSLLRTALSKWSPDRARRHTEGRALGMVKGRIGMTLHSQLLFTIPSVAASRPVPQPHVLFSSSS